MTWYNEFTMALSFFTKQKQNEKLVLLVDVGSSSVGVALVLIARDRAPHVVLSLREDISFQEVLSSTGFLFAMNHALDKVLKRVSGKMSNPKNSLPAPFGEAPAQVFCTLSSPWFILKTRQIHITKNAEFEVSEQVLDTFINEDIVALREDLKETLPPEDLRIIEKKIIHIKLNGYEIKNPYKQKTSRLEMAVTVGVSSEKVTKSIERKINTFFHTNEVRFGAFPVALFNAVRDIFPNEKDFLFLDITGESTDVSRVENDILSNTISFSRGKNFFIREISARLRTVHVEAESLFAMYLRNELDKKKTAQVAETVAQIEEEWLIRFTKALTKLSENGSIPRKIFFTTDTDIAPLFLNLLNKAKSDYLITKSFEVQYLDQFIVSKYVSFESGVIRDPFVVIEALLAEKITKQEL